MAREGKALTPKQLKLVEIVLTHEKISFEEAGRMAGFSQKTAAQTASRAMALPHVKAYYEQQLAARSARTGIDADYVLNRLREIDELDVLDILDHEGALKPVRDWPQAWRRSISGVDVSTIVSGEIETVLKKIKWPDKLKNLELIGKHVGVRAFAEQLEITDKTGIAERLAKAKARVKDRAK